jgi:hypothetical protein
MLDPESLQAFVPLPWPTSFDVPGHLLDDDVFVAPELTFLAVDTMKPASIPPWGCSLHGGASSMARSR